MNKTTKPVTVNDIPLLSYFFRKSTWRDMSIKRFLSLMFRLSFYRRIALSIKDSIQNKRYGSLMGKYSQSHNPFTYIYIGANDGVIGDTIMPYATRYGWKGILVEPVPHVMRKLKQNFGHLDKTVFEQVAIDKSNGKRKLYVVKESEAAQPVFAQIIHSFSKELVKNQKISWGVGRDNDVIPIEVDTVTVMNLIKKHNIENVDLVVIDTEGSDYDILKSMLDDNILPAFIKFEHHNMTIKQQEELKQSFLRYGYQINRMRGDYFCIKK